MPSIVFQSIPISLKGLETVDYDIGKLALAFCYFERLVLYGVGHWLPMNSSTSIRKIARWCAQIAYLYRISSISYVRNQVRKVVLDEDGEV